MKKFSAIYMAALLLIISVCSKSVSGQALNKLPPFSILQTSGKTFSTSDLRPNKPTVLIYYASNCDHCLTLMTAFFKRVSEFKNAQVLMVTFTSLQDVGVFEKKYQTGKYSYLHTGLEAKPLFLQGFYKLQNTPFTALFDKNKNMVYSYKKDASVNDLLKRLKGLK
jgi:thiol-disulfide isomerase/thioredoxin